MITAEHIDRDPPVSKADRRKTYLTSNKDAIATPDIMGVKNSDEIIFINEGFVGLYSCKFCRTHHTIWVWGLKRNPERICWNRASGHCFEINTKHVDVIVPTSSCSTDTEHTQKQNPCPSSEDLYQK